jgi:hypothetical protein
VHVMDGAVQHGGPAAWKAIASNFKVSPGDALRTDGDGLALLAFPWMSILIGSDTEVSLLPSVVLSASLARGRLEEHAVAGDILKVLTPEAEVRGRGHVVVTRPAAGGETAVSSVSGWFRVRGGRGNVSLDPGQGALVAAGAEPRVVDLPAAPAGLSPGSDPVYVTRGRTARLSWTGTAARYHLEVLDLKDDDVVLARDVPGTSLEVPARWLGTFRWRVSSIDDHGLEGLPSAAGLFCVVEK